MKKLILSSLAVLGVSAAFVAPAQAQVLVNSTPPGGSMTGAASFTNFNGTTSAIAGEVTFPADTYSQDVNVILGDGLAAATAAGYTGAVVDGDVVLVNLTVQSIDPGTSIIEADPATSVEAAVAAQLTGLDPAALLAGTAGQNLNEFVSIVRAWTAGLD